MASPAAGVDFDRNRLSQGELIAGIAGFVLLIDLWFKWYGVKVSAAGGLRGFSFGVSANAWESFSLIDIILFLVSLVAIGIAVAKAMNRLPDLPAPVSTILTIVGGVALVLILFRTIDTPVDTHGVSGIDVTRKFGLWLGLLSAAALTYGGWRAMQEAGTSFGDLSAGGAGGGAAPTAPTTPMPAAGEAAPPPAAPAADPVPGETAGQTPPGIAGEPPPPGEETHPPGV